MTRVRGAGDVADAAAAQTYVALLRGVNVSGQRKVAMAELRAGLEALGLHDVRTYLQSGNAVFRAAGREPRSLAGAIHTMLDRDFGHDVDVLVLGSPEFEVIASSNPFVVESEVNAAWLHVTFLLDAAPGAMLPDVPMPAAEGERAVRSGRALYLYLPNGYGRTKLNNTYFERAFATRATTRNWRTVTALAGMASIG